MTFQLVINEKGGAVENKSFDKDEITIGRIKDNDVVLPKNNISKRHARIVRKEGRFKIIDLKSTNGTYINGRRIDGPYDLKEGDKIYVGDFTVELDPGAGDDEAPPQIKRAEKLKPPPSPELSEPHEVEAPAEEASANWADDSEAAAADDGAWSAPVKAGKPGSDDFDLDQLLANAGAASAKSSSDPDEEEEDEEAVEPDAPTGMGPTPTRPAGKEEPSFDAAKSPAAAAPSKEGATGKAAAISRSEVSKSANAKPVSSQTVTSARIEPSKLEPSSRVEPKKMEAQASKSVSAVNIASHAVHKRLLKSLDLRRLDLAEVDEVALRERASSKLEELLDEMAGAAQLPPNIDREELKQAVLDEALGLGPLEELLRDDGVTEIMVNSPSEIYVERHGKLEATNRSFVDDQAVLTVIERIVARVGRRIDESSPMVDARLLDGSRVNAIVPPIAIKGACLTIRKFTRDTLSIDDLVVKNTLTAEMADFLAVAVKNRRSILISGGTGSGKTTSLNVLSSFIPDHERIITIEDAAELRLSQPHVVSLETRPPNLEGRGEISIRELVRNALRMRPDRIVVGECRGGEALDMLQAMNTGHEGSLTTLHANGPRDALARLETLVLMSGMELPMRAIRDQIASALSLVIQQSRLSDGSRRITHIAEVTGLEGDVISMHNIFVFEQTGFDPSGRVKGSYKATGQVPKFYEDLKARGVKVDFDIFQ